MPSDSPKESIWRRELSERGVGAIGLICGCALIYMCLVSPLAAAVNNAPKISLSLTGAVVGPLALGLGLAYSVFGKRAVNVLGHPQRPSALGWVFSLIFVALGILAHLGLKAHLTRSGYSF